MINLIIKMIDDSFNEYLNSTYIISKDNIKFNIFFNVNKKVNDEEIKKNKRNGYIG